VRLRPFGIDLGRSLLTGGRCSEVVVKTELTVQCKQAFLKESAHRGVRVEGEGNYKTPLGEFQKTCLFKCNKT
jgi:hypothetical protein